MVMWHAFLFVYCYLNDRSIFARNTSHSETETTGITIMKATVGRLAVNKKLERQQFNQINNR